MRLKKSPADECPFRVMRCRSKLRRSHNDLDANYCRPTSWAKKQPSLPLASRDGVKACRPEGKMAPQGPNKGMTQKSRTKRINTIVAKPVFNLSADLSKAGRMFWKMSVIRIASAPPGEAPLWVRESWLGLNCPPMAGDLLSLIAQYMRGCVWPEIIPRCFLGIASRRDEEYIWLCGQEPDRSGCT